ncbi:MAG TPA: hypothetical protein VFP34_17410 [Microlunatus sp.]|nr:hypothetical protein [Microlunatus sp.]
MPAPVVGPVATGPAAGDPGLDAVDLVASLTCILSSVLRYRASRLARDGIAAGAG